MLDVVAVDWSGRGPTAAARHHIWLAHCRGGHLLELANGRDRAEVTAYLIALRRRCTGVLVIGLDFSFSFPAWFVQSRGHDDVVALWNDVAEHGETWLDRCPPPFWGASGKRRPPMPEPLRETERAAVGGGRAPKSTFQLFGAGAVGAGALRGMPYLLELRDAGFAIWPFDPPSESTVLELYPRLCTGPVTKSDAQARRAAAIAGGWSLTSDQLEQVTDSDDAFDAALSALVMDRQRLALRSLRRATDARTRLEGTIWDPHNIDA